MAAEGQPLAPLPPAIPCLPNGITPGSSVRRRPIICPASPRVIPAFRIPVTIDRDGEHRARADASRRRAGESRPCRGLDGRQRPAADSAWSDACRHGDGDDGAVVPGPMYEALKEKSQDLLLPGLDKVLARYRRWPQDQSRVRGGLHDGAECRDGARAPVARLPDRSARDIFQALLGNRRGQSDERATSTICARISAARSAPSRPMRRREEFVLLLQEQPAAPLSECDHLSDAGAHRSLGHAAAGHLSRSSTARWSPTSTSSAFR